MYVHVMGIFALFLFFSQVDFALIRLLADWLVTGFSTLWFIQVRCCWDGFVEVVMEIILYTIQDKEVVPHRAEQDRMLSDFEMRLSFNHDGSIITVYPRAFNNPDLPPISSFSIGDEERREGENEEEGEIVLSGNGMHVGTIRG
jgi:hypothetical protein